MTAQEVIEAHAYRAVIEDRIRSLWEDRAWYRTHHGWIPEEQTDARRELRYLIALARKARRLAAGAPDPMTSAKAARFDDEGTVLPDYHDWQAAYR